VILGDQLRRPPPRQQGPRSPNLGVPLLEPIPVNVNDQIRPGYRYGEGRGLGDIHAIAFAQVRRAVCHG